MNGARLLENLFQADPKATASAPKKRAGQGEFASQFLAMLFNESNPKDAVPGRHAGAEKAAERGTAARNADQSEKPAPPRTDIHPGAGGRWSPRFDIDGRPAGSESTDQSETLEPLELKEEPADGGEGRPQRQAKSGISVLSSEQPENPADLLIEEAQEPLLPGNLEVSSGSRNEAGMRSEDAHSRSRFSEALGEIRDQPVVRRPVLREPAAVGGKQTEPSQAGREQFESTAARDDSDILGVGKEPEVVSVSPVKDGPRVTSQSQTEALFLGRDESNGRSAELRGSSRRGSLVEGPKDGVAIADEKPVDPATSRADRRHVHSERLPTREPGGTRPGSAADSTDRPGSSAAPQRIVASADPAPGRRIDLTDTADAEAVAGSEPRPAEEVLQRSADSIAGATKLNRAEVPAPDAKSDSRRESANPDSGRQAARANAAQSSAQANSAQPGTPAEGVAPETESMFRREFREASEMSADAHRTSRPVKAETGSRPVQGPQVPGTGSHWVPGAVVRAEHASAGSRVPVSHAATVSGEAAPERIFEQIVQTTKLERQNGLDRFTVNLKPGFLGRIEIETDLGSDESLRAIIRVEDPTVKKAVEQGLANLVERLGEMGLDIGSAEVTDFLAGDERREGGSARAGVSGNRSRDRGFSEDNAVEPEPADPGLSDDGAFSYFA